MTGQKPFAHSDGIDLLDVGDGEAEDETPDHAEDEFAVPVDDVFGPDVGQMDAHLFDALECLEGVLHLLHAMVRVQVVPTERRVGQDFLYAHKPGRDSALSARCDPDGWMGHPSTYDELD